MKQINPQATTPEEQRARVKKWVALVAWGMSKRDAAKRVHSSDKALRRWAKEHNITVL